MNTGTMTASTTATPPTAPAVVLLAPVLTPKPDGSTEAHLVSGGDYCTCTGFAPNLVWAPDGRTLGLSSLSRALTVNRVDGDGDAVDVRFLPGASGPLSWQPLPAGP